MSASGLFQQAVKGRSIDRLTREIDSRMLAAGCDPYAPHVAEDLSKWPLEAWEDLADEVGVSRPDGKAIAEIVAFFRKRARRGAA
jgi:hypothetical protein